MEPEKPNGRVNLSIEQLEKTLDQKLENAILRLQIELGKIFVSKGDLDNVTRAVKDLEANVIDRVGKVETAQVEQGEQIIALEKDKAGRDAVSNQRRAFFIGGGLAVILQVVSVGLTFYLLAHGSVSGPTTPKH
jgi:hypothetical protein